MELHEAGAGGSIQAIRPKRGGKVELYNFAEDFGETKDLSKEKPELVAKAVDMMNSARTPDPA